MASKKLRKPHQATIDFNNIEIELHKLHDKRQAWDDSLMRAANRELYEILGRCADIYERILPSSTLKSKLTELLKSRNVVHTAGSSLQLKVIRYVFGECGEQFNYARTILVAHNSKPAGVPFEDWLTDQGGPSGIKKSTSKVAKVKSEATAIAKSYFETAPSLASLSALPGLAVNPNADHQFVLALVRIDVSDPSKRDLVYGSNNIALINRVLEVAAKSVPPGFAAPATLPLDLVDLHISISPAASSEVNE